MSRSYAVVAVVDSGINPYHVQFRRSRLVDHPAEYVHGFPETAPSLELSLHGTSMRAALDRDLVEWESIERGELRWIPGTNIIGAIDFEGGSDNRTGFLDVEGHGTAVASLAGGGVTGPQGRRILLVVVRGFARGLRWAARQPWIDVITNSWSEVLPKGFADAAARWSRVATANGKVVCFASMNFGAPLLLHASQGPSWNVNVGAAVATTRGERYDTGYPNDVLGLSGVRAARHDSMRGLRSFAGTSAAAPQVCGHVARTLARVRANFGYVDEGPDERALLRTSHGSGPYLADGALVREELERAVELTARPAATFVPDPNDRESVPALPAVGFLRGGFGIVDESSADDAYDTLLGREAPPEREAETAWQAFTDTIRDALWGSPTQ